MQPLKLFVNSPNFNQRFGKYLFSTKNYFIEVCVSFKWVKHSYIGIVGNFVIDLKKSSQMVEV